MGRVDRREVGKEQEKRREGKLRSVCKINEKFLIRNKNSLAFFCDTSIPAMRWGEGNRKNTLKLMGLPGGCYMAEKGKEVTSTQWKKFPFR